MRPLNSFRASLSGINLIEASAGTGKTYNIASLYIRALIEQPLEVRQILVVTYTEAATKELRERLMLRLRESVLALEGREFTEDEFLRTLPEKVNNSKQAVQKLKTAIRSFDDAAIYTIHGFCYQALQEQAFESRAVFDAELLGDDGEIAAEAIADYWRQWVHEASQSELKRPLLKLLMDKGYTPDTLTGELAPYIGKPYLKIRPDTLKPGNIDKQLYELKELYGRLREQWVSSKKEIFNLLDSGHLSYYRSDWLTGWMVRMQECLNEDVPPLELFDKFEKFTQSAIDRNLKKASERKGIEPPQHTFFKLADSYKAIAASLNKYDITFRLKLFNHLREKVSAKKEELQLLSYDDLLIQLRDALAARDRGGRLAKTLRSTYPLALVDEFQDTDPIQYQIFRSIYGRGDNGSSLFMIGDPKQSIYSFRGADIFAYLEAKGDASEDHRFSLDRNFRSVPKLIEAVNKLFGRHENPFILENISFKRVKAGKDKEKYERLSIDGKQAAPVEIRKLDYASDELPLNKGTAQERSARDTAYQIKQLLRKAEEGRALIGNKKVQAGDIAVLVRSHRQAGLIRDALAGQGIKSVQYSQESVFKSEEAAEIQYILRAVAEPANERFIKTALATNIMGYAAKDLLKFEEDETAWIEKLGRFSEWHSAWNEHGFAFMFRLLLNDEHIADQVIGLEDGERKLTNLIHLSELLQQEEQNGKTGTRSLLQWLARKRDEDQKDLEEEQLRLESDENLVKVVTIHRSKGLEYPIVFCPFLWKGPRYSDDGAPIVYHDENDKSQVYLDFSGKDDPERNRKRFQMAKEDLAENIRLAYVAITRAEQKCVISWVYASKSEYSPLGYLLLEGHESFKVLNDTISTESKYKPVESGKFNDSITGLIRKSPALFTLNPEISTNQHELNMSGSSSTPLVARSFEREKALEEGLSISSFSSLVRNEQEDFTMDYELFFDEPFGEDTASGRREELSIFNFPKGPKPGTAIHHIFEQIDFNNQENLNDVIIKNLEKQGIKRRWVPVISGMVNTVLMKNLTGTAQELRLSSLKRDDFIPELEFYFRCGEVKLKELLNIIRPGSDIPSSLNGFADGGFMKGFIDLTFEYDGRYYILDYKTNHLGNSISDYGAKHIQTEMEEAMYDLQYHIYIVALHRYLSKVISGYSYQTHLGGAFYLFLRGMNKEGDEGIYFHCPEPELIKELDFYLERRELHDA